MLIHTFRDAESESTKSCVYGDVTTVSDVSLHRRIHRGLEGVRTPPQYLDQGVHILAHRMSIAAMRKQYLLCSPAVTRSSKSLFSKVEQLLRLLLRYDTIR